MATRTFIGDSGGTARRLSRLFVGDSGGVARQIKRLFVGDSGGVARLIYQYLVVTMSSVNLTANSFSPTNSTVSLQIISAGTWTATPVGGSTSGSASGTWLTAGAASDIEVRLTGTGTTPSGSALSSWLSTSSTRTWSLATGTGGDTFSFSGTLEFRAAATGTVLSITTVDMSVVQI